MPLSSIGTLNEGSLHAALKQEYLGADGAEEVAVGSHVADVLRDGVIYEIQTSSFSGLGNKMRALIKHYPVVLVHPISVRRTLLRMRDEQTGEFTKRVSPKHGKLIDIVGQLVYVPELLGHANFSVEAVLTEEEELTVFDAKARRGRGGWRRRGRSLVNIQHRQRFASPTDLLSFFQAPLPDEFDSAEISRALGEKRDIGQQMAYCLRHLGLIEISGKQGNSLRYTLNRSLTKAVDANAAITAKS